MLKSTSTIFEFIGENHGSIKMDKRFFELIIYI